MLNDQLLKTALVGTAKVPPVPIDSNSEVDRLTVVDDSLTDESQFLLRVGRFACYEQTGQLPVVVPQLQQAPFEDQVALSIAFEKIFEEVLRKENYDLLPEFLAQMRSRNLSVPNRLLPAILEIKDEFLRPMVRNTVGTRGLWLSQFNPEWDWINSAFDTENNDLEQLRVLWNDGTSQERLAAIEAIRQIDSKLGRDLLKSTFSQEKADERKQFLSTFVTGLCEADEEFLVSALANRSKYVKEEAARLLSLLPQSEMSRRNQQRALEIIKKVEAQKTPIKLKCTPPQEFPMEWEHDGIAEKPKSHQGQRAFWTEELLSRIPLGFWTTEFAATPVELLNGILNDDYAHAVITGWTRAHSSCIDRELLADWREPLWRYWTAMLQHRQQGVVLQALEQLPQLAKELPQAILERAVLQLLQSQHDPASLPIAEILKWISGNWSNSFSVEYLRITRALVGGRSDKAVYDWVSASSEVAASLSPDAFHAALAPWKIRDHGVQSWQISGIENQLNTMIKRVLLRSRFHQELRSHFTDS